MSNITRHSNNKVRYNEDFIEPQSEVEDDKLSDSITTTSDGGSSTYAQDSFDDAFVHVQESRNDTCQSISSDETLLIFDYDDTLFPTSFLAQKGYKLDGPDASPEIQAILDEYSTVVEETLIDARQHGRVVIVTNAESGWVTLTAQKFMPRLGSILSSFPSISARSTYEPLGISNPFEWKLKAFERVIYEHHHALSSPDAAIGRMNVLSFGDSIHERDAAHQVCASLSSSPLFCKSIKFIERPDIAQLTKQHVLIRDNLSKVVAHEGTLDLCIECQQICTETASATTSQST
jgi:hypothetical protein